MKKLHLIITLSFLCAFASGQVPGYMGLKFSIKYDAGIMEPALVGRTGPLPMLYNNVSADYVVSRHISVGLKYCYMTYNAKPEPDQFDGATYAPANYKGRFTEQTAACIVKFFPKKRGCLAPFGRYVSFGVYYQYAVSREATTYPNGDFSDGQGNEIAPIGFKGTADYGGFILGGGRNYIVANRLIIDLGCNINVPLGIVNIFNDDLTTEKGVIYRDVALRNLLQLYLGFGVLAF